MRRPFPCTARLTSAQDACVSPSSAGERAARAASPVSAAARCTRAVLPLCSAIRRSTHAPAPPARLQRQALRHHQRQLARGRARRAARRAGRRRRRAGRPALRLARNGGAAPARIQLGLRRSAAPASLGPARGARLRPCSRRQGRRAPGRARRRGRRGLAGSRLRGRRCVDRGGVLRRGRASGRCAAPGRRRRPPAPHSLAAARGLGWRARGRGCLAADGRDAAARGRLVGGRPRLGAERACALTRQPAALARRGAARRGCCSGGSALLELPCRRRGALGRPRPGLVFALRVAAASFARGLLPVRARRAGVGAGSIPVAVVDGAIAGVCGRPVALAGGREGDLGRLARAGRHRRFGHPVRQRRLAVLPRDGLHFHSVFQCASLGVCIYSIR